MSQRPAEPIAGTLAELTAQKRRVALVGLAKNTGKTEALAALLRELETIGRNVGVTSVGRDGEERDVIEPLIEKPRITLREGSLVATTDALLRASGLSHDLLERTDFRTPLGQVVVARLRRAGAIEVAGPSAASQVQMVSNAMLGHGAEQVLIDGAIDRRAASSPQISDGLIMSTGAVLSGDPADVVKQTCAAVELVRLPVASNLSGAIDLPARFALTSDAEEIGAQLDAYPAARQVNVPGALPESFLKALLAAAHRRRRTYTVVVADATRVFLADRDVDWFSKQGLDIAVICPIDLLALTINPLAPRSHRLDSAHLRGLLRESIDRVPVLDVLDSSYPDAGV